MAEAFLRETVGAWPALRFEEAKDMLFNAMLPLASGTKPVPRLGFGTRLIYLVGGYEQEGGRLSKTVLYDPQAASWTQRASMAGPRSEPRGLQWHVAAAMGGKIYVTGGRNQDESSVNSAYVYDPQANAWTQLASMGNARRKHAFAAVGGKLYVFAGYGAGTQRLRTAEVYDPASDSWAPVTSLASAFSSLVAVAL